MFDKLFSKEYDVLMGEGSPNRFARILDAITPHRRTPRLSHPILLPLDADEARRRALKQIGFIGMWAAGAIAYPKVLGAIFPKGSSTGEIQSFDDLVLRPIESSLQLFGSYLTQFREILNKSRSFFAESRDTIINNDNEPFELYTVRYASTKAIAREKTFIKMTLADTTHAVSEISVGTETYPLSDQIVPATIISSDVKNYGIRIDKQNRKVGYMNEIKDGKIVPGSELSTDGTSGQPLPTKTDIDNFYFLLSDSMKVMM